MRVRALIVAMVLGVFAAVLNPLTGSARAADPPTVTLVNHTGGTVWIGAVAEDGFETATGLPTLEDQESATVTLPANERGQWFGKFVPRQRCTGEDGDLHCQVGDCGPYADRCSNYKPEPGASYAEFHFDPDDALGHWYNASYVDGYSVPVTVDADVDDPPETGECSRAGCPEDLMEHCPPDNVVRDPDTDEPVLCQNPDPDSPDTEYSRSLSEHCPKAYTWSRQDTVPGNDVVRNCTRCSGATVTFH
ncbi:thaumatin family protein [Streptomyces sp. NPDC005438]|uniref:thaumatin family protein n=1 Tax=Streptomyces sp. NPDC005438 TaxID=3156880 RepID=UPI0033BF78A5